MQRYDIGRTFGRAFAAMKDGLGSVGLFLLAISVLTQAVQLGLYWVMGQQMQQVAAGDDPAAVTTAMFGAPLYWLAIAASTVLSTVGTAGAISGYARLTHGQSTGIDACINQGLARFLPVLGLTILWWLGITLGFAVLIVPGVILIVIWAAALPALVVERAGVFDAFGRSRALTRGSRGSVFGTLLLLSFILYAPALVLGIGVLGGMEQFLNAPGDGLPYLMIAGSTVYGWFAAMVLNAFLVSIHHELVDVNEGGSTGELTEVFG